MTAVLEANGLQIDVSELLRQPGSSKHIHLEEEVPGLSLDLVHVSGPAVVDLTAESLVEGVLATGTVSGSLACECRRCLVSTTDAFSVPVSELFVTGSAAGDEHAYPVIDERIDLEPMVRDAVVLGLPLNPLCRPDCKGLCPQCGQDLNVADCGHRPDTTDARWEPLRRLLDSKGE